MLAALLLVAASHASDACSGVKVKEDPFTHRSVAHVAGVYDWWIADFSDGSVTLSVSLTDDGVHTEVMAAGSKVLFLMKDGSVVTLTAATDIQPVPQNGATSVVTAWTPKFAIDKATATLLGAQPMKYFRSTLPSGDHDVGLPPVEQKAFTRAFGCYATLMP